MKKPWEFERPLCAEISPDSYFMEDDGSYRSSREYKELRALCHRCEHIADCAEWGIARERFGVWGGLTPRERQSIRRRRRIEVKELLGLFA